MKKEMQFTRKQMIGKVSTLDGAVILEYQHCTRDSKGNFLNCFKVRTVEGELDSDFVHPSDQVPKWYVDDGTPEAKRVCEETKQRLVSQRQDEANNVRWSDCVAKILMDAGVPEKQFSVKWRWMVSVDLPPAQVEKILMNSGLGTIEAGVGRQQTFIKPAPLGN